MLKYEKRLRTLAHRAGLYRLHLTRLWCLQGTYTAEWEGSHAQLQELVTLWSRTDPYYDHIPPQGRCPCGGPRFCETCCNAASARVHVPEDLYTPEERARLYELLGLLRVKEPPGRSQDAV
jgi:hypothetical protein